MYAIFRQSDSAKWMAVDVHSDTVSVAHMPGDPFSGVVDDERKLHGRGSCDTKASLAICVGVYPAPRGVARSWPRNPLDVG